jgi:hypothetical protein
VRYLEPLPGFAGQSPKAQRYVQEKGSLTGIYLPPLFRASWREMASDPTVSLYITEGELKSASASYVQRPTIGVAGVDSWKSSKRGIALLPELQAFVWKGRKVRIVYDSDLATKPDVVRAQRSLAQELLAHGAQVEILNLPPPPNGGKVGLDDFIVTNGAPALDDLEENATPFPESDALWGLNADALYVKSMDGVIERASDVLYDRTKWVHGTAANRHYMETVVKGSGEKARVSLVKKPLAPRWISWEHRAEVDRLVYEPGQGREVDGQWNVWPGWGCEPKKGDIGPWLWLLEFLFKDENVTRAWFEKWLAYPLQHPGAKMYAACLFWSREQRIGKSFVAYIMQRIYGKNWVEIKSKDLDGNFNTWAKNRQFVYGDEIKGNDAKVDSDWFKGLITQEEVTIEEKFLPKYVVKDHMNYYCSSNHPDALFLEDRDQRFLIHEIVGAPAPRAQYEVVDKWMHNGGAAALFDYLLSMNLGTFNPREHAPDTPGKRSMILLGKTDVALWVHLLREDPPQALKALGEGLVEKCDLYSARHLFRAFNPEGKTRASESSLGRALATAGLRQLNHGMPIRVGTSVHRMYAVRNYAKWEAASKKEISEHYLKFWGSTSEERKL